MKKDKKEILVDLITTLYPAENLTASINLLSIEIGCSYSKIYKMCRNEIYSVRRETLAFLNIKEELLNLRKEILNKKNKKKIEENYIIQLPIIFSFTKH